MNLADAFEVKKKEISVSGYVVNVHRMKLKNAIKLMAIIDKNRASVLEKIKDKNEAVVFQVIMACADNLQEILSILCGEEIGIDLCENMTVLELSQLAIAITEVNDFSEIIGNFTTAAAKLTEQKPAKK
jgi:hypothetical protein